jgi:CO dehydrogenase/acetyl-CoA synthase beta subunit
MPTFDAQIRRVAEYVEALREIGRPTKVVALASSVGALTEGLPVRVGPGANPKIILRSDTFVELGNPGAGSCALVLWTDTPALISDGRMTLIGPDVLQAAGTSLPFGQVVLVGGSKLSAAEHLAIGQTQYVGDQIEGYMVRSSSRSIWSRVSKDAAAKGFCFETLARAVMAIYRTSLAKVEAVEVVFVTSGRDDVLRLNDIATEVRDLGTEIVQEHWKARGYDLTCDLDCRSCHDKDVCDDVRKVIAARLRRERKAAAKHAS